MGMSVSSASGRSNGRVVVVCLAMVAGMVGLSYAAVPLYDLFCRVTGFAGTTQQAEAGSEMLGETTMKVEFDSTLARGMPWTFRPVQRSMTVRTGETGLAFYRATNPTDRTITGTASFNVAPLKAGQYFVKIECFCFTEQTLAPGESADMPVQFYVDPAIEQDPNADEVRTITLSYTFFEAKPAKGEPDSRVSAAGGDGAARRE
ncbi:cytochrome c oxidase assembly protein [Minwuia thermotolerans]|uniref:Cytochrome c oxidase assembly protein CtaG n=2 Tax=Minwuia thermotolerans TaxID=2056226 RepID=A0A2M9G519_9PROT|nr:cytochrome c oxidase assembly protein [Minwuia thermotolerans]